MDDVIVMIGKCDIIAFSFFMHSKILDKYKLEQSRRNLVLSLATDIFHLSLLWPTRTYTSPIWLLRTNSALFLFILLLLLLFLLNPTLLISYSKKANDFFFVCIFKISKEQHRLQALGPWESHMNDDNETSIQNYPHPSKIDNFIQFLQISSMETHEIWLNTLFPFIETNSPKSNISYKHWDHEGHIWTMIMKLPYKITPIHPNLTISSNFYEFHLWKHMKFGWIFYFHL